MASLTLLTAAMSFAGLSPGWVHSEKASVAPFGEQVHSSMATLAAESNDTRLTVKCDRSPKPALSIQLRRNPGAGPWQDGRLLLQLDSSDEQVVSWQMMSGIVYTQAQKEARKIARALAKAQQFAVTGRDVTGAIVQSTFRTGVGTAALIRVIEGC